MDKPYGKYKVKPRQKCLVCWRKIRRGSAIFSNTGPHGYIIHLDGYVCIDDRHRKYHPYVFAVWLDKQAYRVWNRFVSIAK